MRCCTFGHLGQSWTIQVAVGTDRVGERRTDGLMQLAGIDVRVADSVMEEESGYRQALDDIDSAADT